MNDNNNSTGLEILTQKELDRTQPSEKESQIWRSTMSHIAQLALEHLQDFDANNLTQEQIDAIVFADTPEEVARFFKEHPIRKS